MKTLSRFESCSPHMNKNARTPHESDLIIQSSDFALMNIATLASSGALDLSPKYQRRNRWDIKRQSQLIESFILNVPVPPVYLAEEARGVYAVIDGKQRLTAISNFLEDGFALRGLQLSVGFEGLQFSDLPVAIQNSLRIRPLRVVTVLNDTKEWIKHEVFIRLNRGGQPLNAQEIRNVAYAGRLNDAIIESAEHPFLKRQLKIANDRSPSYADMSNVEMVVRFLALRGTWERFGGSMSNAMDEFMRNHQESDPSEVGELMDRFNRGLFYAEALWGNHAFQRYSAGQWRDQLIGGVYDAQLVAIDSTPDKMLEALVGSGKAVLETTSMLFSDEQFDAAVRIGTNTPSKVSYRISAMAQMLRGA